MVGEERKKGRVRSQGPCITGASGSAIDTELHLAGEHHVQYSLRGPWQAG